MTDTLLDFSQRAELLLEARIIGTISAIAEAEKIPLMIVGAFARDLHLHYGHGIEIQRATHDLDLALAIEGWGDFATLHRKLVLSGAFNPVPNVAHKLIHSESNYPVDLVPFGSVETAGRQIVWPPSGESRMGVFGFTEALKAAINVRLPGNVSVRLVSLPALAMLKIVCWSERHYRSPRKDSQDLRLILRNYLAAGNEKRLWDEFVRWTQDDEFDYEIAGARMAGYDIRSLLDEAGFRLLDNLLAEQGDASPAAELPSEMDPNEPENAARLLRAVVIGLNETQK